MEALLGLVEDTNAQNRIDMTVNPASIQWLTELGGSVVGVEHTT